MAGGEEHRIIKLETEEETRTRKAAFKTLRRETEATKRKLGQARCQRFLKLARLQRHAWQFVGEIVKQATEIGHYDEREHEEELRGERTSKGAGVGSTGNEGEHEPWEETLHELLWARASLKKVEKHNRELSLATTRFLVERHRDNGVASTLRAVKKSFDGEDSSSDDPEEKSNDHYEKGSGKSSDHYDHYEKSSGKSSDHHGYHEKGSGKSSDHLEKGSGKSNDHSGHYEKGSGKSSDNFEKGSL